VLKAAAKYAGSLSDTGEDLVSVLIWDVEADAVAELHDARRGLDAAAEAQKNGVQRLV